jgi:hypothetical protein
MNHVRGLTQRLDAVCYLRYGGDPSVLGRLRWSPRRAAFTPLDCDRGLLRRIKVRRRPGQDRAFVQRCAGLLRGLAHVAGGEVREGPLEHGQDGDAVSWLGDDLR